MREHPVFGISAPELGWVPALRYSLRRQRVLALLDSIPHGRALEIGCGAGALLHDLASRGFACAGLETSHDARELARAINPEIEVHAAPQADWQGRFDVLLSFEVLEHIDDDNAALAQWREWLVPGGRVILSVPARPELWNASDVWAGHFRRYTRAALIATFERAGFAVEHAECYGYPLANLTDRVRGWIYDRRRRRAGRIERAELTAHSGIDRGVESKLYPLQSSALGTLLFRAFCRWQEKYLDREVGSGHLVVAVRR